MKRLLLILFFTTFLNVFAQQQTHSVSFNRTDIKEVLAKIENTFNVRFSFQPQSLAQIKFSCKPQKIALQDLLDLISETTKLQFIKLAERYYVIIPKSENITRQELKEVVINAYLTEGISKNKDGGFTISLDKLGILAGLIEPDVLESIQQLPGVISPNETATNFSIRGGAYDQNLVYFDGIPIYQNGHLFGMISPFNPHIVKKVKYYFKGTPAQYEGGVSGIIDLSTDNRIAKKFKFEVGVNALSADAIFETPLIKKKLSLSLSARSSYRELWDTPGLKQFENKVFANTNIATETVDIEDFRFSDVNLKLNSEFFKNQNVSLSFIHISSGLNFNNKVPGLPNYDYTNKLDNYTNGFSTIANNTITDKLDLQTVFDIAWYDLTYVNDTKKDQELIGRIDKENFVSHTSIGTELRYKMNKKHRFNFGYQYNEKRTAYLFKSKIGDKSYIFDYMKDVNNTQAIYTNYIYRNKKIVDVNAGIRMAYYQEHKKFFIEPRLVVSKQILRNLKFQLTGEIKHQNIQQINKTVIGLLNLENKIWQTSNPDNFPPMASNQLTAGLLFTKNKWHIELDAYRKNTDDITISVPFRIYDKHQFLLGKSFTKGLDFYIKKRYRHFEAWASYSLMKSSYRFKALKHNTDFISDLQIQHKLMTTLMYKRKHLNLAMSWLWHSPRPYYKNIISDQPVEQIGNIKQDFKIAYLTPYSRADFSALYQYRLSPKSLLKFGFSIRNLFNRKNLLSREQNSYGLDSSLLNFDRFGLNRVYNVMLRFYWQ